MKSRSQKRNSFLGNDFLGPHRPFTVL